MPIQGINPAFIDFLLGAANAVSSYTFVAGVTPAKVYVGVFSEFDVYGPVILVSPGNGDKESSLSGRQGQAHMVVDVIAAVPRSEVLINIGAPGAIPIQGFQSELDRQALALDLRTLWISDMNRHLGDCNQVLYQGPQWQTMNFKGPGATSDAAPVGLYDCVGYRLIGLYTTQR